MRVYSKLDRLLIKLGDLPALGCARHSPARPYPARSPDAAAFDAKQQAESSRYMRVNHVGEICAQALYQSQALTAANPAVREKMRQASLEERDHLAWCETRLDELGGRPSRLNPLWYAGSFAIGAAAGLAGDKWNLGFVAETETQVAAHLAGHLDRLPAADRRSREIVAQMQADEARHADEAVAAGAAPLPAPVKRLMQFAAGVMTRTAYWI